MKNFNKLFVGLVLAFVGIGMASYLQASVVARSPKRVSNILYTTTVSSISVVNTTGAVVAAMQEPGAVYQVMLSTGAVGDYFVLYDTGNVLGISLAAGPASAQLTGKIFVSTNTANTLITFDPPIMFFNGLVGILSSANTAASVTWESGRGLSGQ